MAKYDLMRRELIDDDTFYVDKDSILKAYIYNREESMDDFQLQLNTYLKYSEVKEHIYPLIDSGKLVKTSQEFINYDSYRNSTEGYNNTMLCEVVDKGYNNNMSKIEVSKNKLTIILSKSCDFNYMKDTSRFYRRSEFDEKKFLIIVYSFDHSDIELVKDILWIKNESIRYDFIDFIVSEYRQNEIMKACGELKNKFK